MDGPHAPRWQAALAMAAGVALNNNNVFLSSAKSFKALTTKPTHWVSDGVVA